MKKIHPLVFILFACFSQYTYAQKIGTRTGEQVKSLRDSLKMSSKDYKDFTFKMKLFADSTKSIMSDTSLTREKKRTEVQLIQLHRKIFLQSTLSDTQYQSYNDYEKTLMNLSPHKKLLQEQEDKFKQKKAKEVKPNTNQ
jgi:hypothetical protein